MRQNYFGAMKIVDIQILNMSKESERSNKITLAFDHLSLRGQI